MDSVRDYMSEVSTGWWTGLRARHLRIALVYLALYVALDWVSYVHPVGAIGITPWNPPTGLSFALVLLFGREFIPWLFVAPLLANYIVIESPLPIGTILGGAVIFGVGYGAATSLLLTPALRFDRRLGSKMSLLQLLGVAAASAILVAVAYVALLVVTGALPIEQARQAIARQWIGDMIGITVLTPFLLLFTRSRSLVPSWELVALAAVLGVVLLGVFGLAESFRLQLFYLFFVPVIWTAVRFGLEGVTAGLVLTQLGLIAAIHYSGVSAADVTSYQALMVVLAMTGLALGVVVNEQQRTQQQLRINQEALERAARLDSVGAFAAALAHEINQPLTAIANYTRLAKRFVEKDPPDTSGAAEAAEHAIQQVDRAAEVVRRLRDLIRLGRNEMAVHSVADLVREAVELCRHDVAIEGAQLEVRVARNLPPVLGDGLQIQQVLVNLVRNAAEAISGAGRSEGRIVIEAALQGGDRVVVRVRDNGPGFDSSVIERAQTPFTTTKEEGLGLGLALARSIAETHGGQLAIESSASGAQVSFTLATQRRS